MRVAGGRYDGHMSLVLSRFASTSLCSGLTAAETEQLFTLFEVVTFSPGVPLYREGEKTDALYVLLEGEVEVSALGEAVARVGAGETLGELSLFRGKPTSSATVTAERAVIALKVPREVFRARLAVRDVTALTVISNLAHQMADRLLAVNERLINESGKVLPKSRAR